MNFINFKLRLSSSRWFHSIQAVAVTNNIYLFLSSEKEKKQKNKYLQFAVCWLCTLKESCPNDILKFGV